METEERPVAEVEDPVAGPVEPLAARDAVEQTADPAATADAPAAPATPEAGKPARLLSLDAFRGFTIFGMLLVNNISLDRATPKQLMHAHWNAGIHFADLVFP